MTTLGSASSSTDADEALSTLAALDCGTNSFHLVIAEVDAGGRFTVVAREKEMVRLGAGGGDMKLLDDAAMDRGIGALDRMRRLAASHDAALSAVATSAVREAANGAHFLERAKREAGVEISVIRGTEEARLIHLGALAAVPLADRRHLVIDIGGGSTEFIVGDGPEALLVRSLKLGAIRLTDRFFAKADSKRGSVDRGAVNRCRTHVRAMLIQVADEVEAVGFDVAVGCSGTMESMLRVAAGLALGDPPESMANVRVDAETLQRGVDEILVADAQARLGMGIDPKRIDLMTAGAILISEIVKRLGIEALTFSDYALREGLLIDRSRRRDVAELDHLSDLRRSSVFGVAERYHEDLTHVERITRMALELFDATTREHELGPAARELLEAASLLHNVGLFVSHSSHHKHSSYLIRHSEALAGFTMAEIEVIAQVARYHRKSTPKPKHAEFAALSTTDQHQVRVLAGILRIAIALDRTRTGNVEGLSVARVGRELVVQAHTAPNVDLTLELYTANTRTTVLADALAKPVVVEQLAAR